MLKLIALILLAHAWSVSRGGRVTISEGFRSRIVTRDEAPVLVSFHCLAYVALAIVLALLP